MGWKISIKDPIFISEDLCFQEEFQKTGTHFHLKRWEHIALQDSKLGWTGFSPTNLEPIGPKSTTHKMVLGKNIGKK